MPKDDWAKARRADIARKAGFEHRRHVDPAERFLAKQPAKPKRAKKGSKPKQLVNFIGRTPCKIYFDSTVKPPVRIELSRADWIW